MVRTITVRTGSFKTADAIATIEEFMNAPDGNGPIDLYLPIDDYQTLEASLKMLFDEASITRIKNAVSEARRSC